MDQTSKDPPPPPLVAPLLPFPLPLFPPVDAVPTVTVACAVALWLPAEQVIE